MIVLRLLTLLGVLFLAGLGVAFLVTRDRRYLRIAWRTLQALLVLAVGYGLLYVFGRVLLG